MSGTKETIKPIDESSPTLLFLYPFLLQVDFYLYFLWLDSDVVQFSLVQLFNFLYCPKIDRVANKNITVTIAECSTAGMLKYKYKYG